MLGSRQTLLETNDGGKTWNPRQVAAAQDEGFNYRFQSISFAGEEGWIVGKPAILLHTKDGGKNWDRVPLSGKLPGNPVLVVATGSSKAEMTTDQVQCSGGQPFSLSMWLSSLVRTIATDAGRLGHMSARPRYLLWIPQLTSGWQEDTSHAQDLFGKQQVFCLCWRQTDLSSQIGWNAFTPISLGGQRSDSVLHEQPAGSSCMCKSLPELLMVSMSLR